jgi:hypothetical protein
MQTLEHYPIFEAPDHSTSDLAVDTEIDQPAHEQVELSRQELEDFATLTDELTNQPESAPKGISMSKSASSTDLMTIRHK